MPDTDPVPYTPPPADQTQLDALAAYRSLLEAHRRAVEAHWQATDNLMTALLLGRQGQKRDAAYKAQGDTARAMLQAFAAMQGAAQRVGDAIAKHELRVSRVAPDVVTGRKGAPRKGRK